MPQMLDGEVFTIHYMGLMLYQQKIIQIKKRLIIQFVEKKLYHLQKIFLTIYFHLRMEISLKLFHFK